jgi:hypothetical protein
MTGFTVRVELHGADGKEYETLHQSMARYGFRRTIRGVDARGATHDYVLPTAEYDHQSTSTSAEVRDLAKRIADSVRTGAWVLVTQVADRAWSTHAIA